MQTHIYTSKKLEKLIKKLIQTNEGDTSGILGKWNATVFYVNRKKCWLVSNAKTQYSVILTDIKAADLRNIEQLFKNAFFAQLIYDGILVDYGVLSAQIGTLSFHPTDNDKRTTGFQNQRLQTFQYWIEQFGSIENMPIKKLANRLNSDLIHMSKNRRNSDYTTSIKEIKKVLATLA
ncbi:DUF6933 domain-containing protein [Aequorivita flava]|uniref:DUF6933 domain-containing protein n=1 Tax=Aequorivita flava TaxID=3114371 RepID=A0AB35YKI3_9FLAO